MGLHVDGRASVSVSRLMARACKVVNGCANSVFVASLTGIVAYNVHKWGEDSVLSERLRGHVPPSRPVLRATPKVTVLVAAWNEAQIIARHIESVMQLRYASIEYVLCAGGSDDTLVHASRYHGPGVIVLEQLAGEGKQRALNKAFARATGEIIYLTDADCILDDVSFETVLAPIINQGWAAATGLSRPLDDQLGHPLARYQWYRDTYWLLRNGPCANGVLGRNAAVRAEVLRAGGAFSQEVPSGTDYHLSGLLHDNGILIANTRSMVQTRVPSSFTAYVKMWQRWIKNLIIQGPGSHRLGEALQAVVAGMLGGALVSGPCWLLAGGLPSRLWLLLVCWGWMQRLRQTRASTTVLSRSESWPYLHRIAMFLFADAVAAASTLPLMLRANWRVKW